MRAHGIKQATSRITIVGLFALLAACAAGDALREDVLTAEEQQALTPSQMAVRDDRGTRSSHAERGCPPFATGNRKHPTAPVSAAP